MKKIQIAWIVTEEVPAGIWGREGSFGVKKVTNQGYRTTEAKQISLQMSQFYVCSLSRAYRDSLIHRPASLSET